MLRQEAENKREETVMKGEEVWGNSYPSSSYFLWESSTGLLMEDHDDDSKCKQKGASLPLGRGLGLENKLSSYPRGFSRVKLSPAP